MSKPLTAPQAFSGLSPPWSLTQLDSNFSSIAAAINDSATYSNYLIDQSGAANSIVVNFPAGITAAYTAGLLVQFKIAITCTGACTLNVNSLGATNLVNPDGSAMSPGQLQALGIYVAQYDGTQFQLLGSIVGPAQYRTAAEITAGVVPVNYGFFPGHLYRYGTNTTPGTTDMSTALTNALAVSQAVYIPQNSHLLSQASAFSLLANQTLYGDGDLSSLTFSFNTGSNLVANGVNNVTVKNLKLTVSGSGNPPTYVGVVSLVLARPIALPRGWIFPMRR